MEPEPKRAKVAPDVSVLAGLTAPLFPMTVPSTSPTSPPDGFRGIGLSTMVSPCAESNMAQQYDSIEPSFSKTGNTAVVTKARRKSDNKVFAVKTMHIYDEAATEAVKHEIRMLRRVEAHPNVVHLEQVFYDRWDVHCVQTLCAGGELFDSVVQLPDGRYSESSAATLFRQIIAAVDHCHKQGVCHRDIKPENLLFLDGDAAQGSTKKSSLKLVDFGLSADIKCNGDRMTRCCGTERYSAPEVLAMSATRFEGSVKRGYYTKACDLWSCGVVLYVLLCGCFPYAGTEEVMLGKMGDPTAANCSEEALQVVHGLLCVDPTKRWDCTQVLSSKWLTKAPKKMLYSALKGIQLLRSEVLLHSSMRQFVADSLVREEKALHGHLREEMERMRRAFEVFDHDGDGVVSLCEFRQSLEALGFRMAEQHSELFFRLIDQDCNKGIDFNEFVAMTMASNVVCRGKLLHQAFTRMDAAHTGFIGVQELASFFPSLGQADLEQLVSKIDTNKDGKIEYYELRNYVERDISCSGAPLLKAFRKLRKMIALSSGEW